MKRDLCTVVGKRSGRNAFSCTVFCISSKENVGEQVCEVWGWQWLERFWELLFCLMQFCSCLRSSNMRNLILNNQTAFIKCSLAEWYYAFSGATVSASKRSPCCLPEYVYASKYKGSKRKWCWNCPEMCEPVFSKPVPIWSLMDLPSSVFTCFRGGCPFCIWFEFLFALWVTW